ncbi:MAG: CvpA family protein [Oscillospiraceae bacterium]|nr:CvpA family protein [Oscillospiraceae bacterium]
MSIGIPLYYDIVLVAVLFLFFFIFYKRGFVASIVDVFGVVFAFLCGNYLSVRAARKIYDSLIKDRILAYVTEQIVNIQSGLEETLSKGLIGKLFTNFIENRSLDTEASTLAESFVSNSLESGCINIVRVAVFLVVFVLSILVFKLLGGALQGINDLPLVGFPNQLLGGAVGLIIGLLLMFILCSLISLILNVWHTSWLNKEVIESSFLFSRLFKLNPFYS